MHNVPRVDLSIGIIFGMKVRLIFLWDLLDRHLASSSRLEMGFALVKSIRVCYF